MNTTLRQLGLRGVAAAALLAVSATPGLTSLSRAHASCGGWQYISQAQTNGINVFLVRDACNNTFAYSDNAPANSGADVAIYDQYGHFVSRTVITKGSGPLQSDSLTITCGPNYNYQAQLSTVNYGNAYAPSGAGVGHNYC